MLEKINVSSAAKIVWKTLFGLIAVFGLIAPAFGQTAENAQAAPVQSADKKRETLALMPLLTEYKGVKIGATADQVREKLGKAKIEDKDGFFYDRDNEMVQIRLDADKKVTSVSTTYSDKNENSPEFADIFGTEVPVPAKPDGSVYKLVDYPEAGYWVAYSRAAGEKAAVTVTMQKL